MDVTSRNVNLRTAQMNGMAGTNPTENEGIMPGATPFTPGQKETNETVQYWGGQGAGSGPWGGEAESK